MNRQHNDTVQKVNGKGRAQNNNATLTGPTSAFVDAVPCSPATVLDMPKSLHKRLALPWLVMLERLDLPYFGGVVV
jgi:hypothetical protein